MKQTRTFSLFFLLFILNGFIPALRAQTKSSVDYVNPFLGTDFFGHTFPGASLPFAMVHVSPDTGTEGWTHCAGYIWQASSIMGFSHTHWSGVGMVDGGDILLMPVTGNKLQVTPGTDENPDAGYRSRFSHSRETASPGYYSVFLEDYKIEIITDKISNLQHRNGRLNHIVFANGNKQACEAIFFVNGFQQQVDLAKEIGCQLSNKGVVKTNKLQGTEIEGLFVAGDASKDMHFVVVAAAEGAKAGVSINKELQKEALETIKGS